MARVHAVVVALALAACAPPGAEPFSGAPVAPAVASAAGATEQPSADPAVEATAAPDDPSAVGATEATPTVRAVAGVLPVAPIPGRSRPLAAWVGERLWVWGGFGEPADPGTGLQRREGAIYDQGEGVWNSIEQPELAPDFMHHAVWTGEEVLVWGHQGGGADPVGAAAYDPAADRWRPLPTAPLPRADLTGALWTGAELLVWGTDAGLPPTDDGTASAGYGTLAFAAYDPQADAWREVPSPPLEGPRFGPATVWTGEQLVVWGGTRGAVSTAAGCTVVCNDPVVPLPGAAAYDTAAERWTQLPAPPPAVQRGGLSVGLGDRVLVSGGEPLEPWRFFLYDPFAGTAAPVAESVRATRVSAAVAAAGRAVVITGPQGSPGDPTPLEAQVYDPGADTWTTLPVPDFGANEGITTVASADRVLLVGGYTLPSDFDGGQPPHAAGGAVVDPLASAPAPVVHADGFGLTVSVADDQALPFTVSVEAPPTLPANGRTRAVLMLTAHSDVFLPGLFGEAATTPATLQAGDGRLIALGGHQGAIEDPAHPELGVQAGTTQLLPGGLYLTGRTARSTLTLLTQPPPFAPAEGTYTQPVEVSWWHRREPPEPYPPEPDGLGTITLTYTLTR